jgi:flagellar basal body-associated protein FliL
MGNIRDKKKAIIIALILVIVILLMVIVYLFWIKPSLNGLITQGWNDGYTFAVVSLMQQASSCQPVPIYFENQTINVIAIECLQ